MDNLERARELYVDGSEKFNAGRFHDAEISFREAQGLAPDRISILISLSAALLKQGKFADGKAACHAAIALNDAAPEPRFNLGLIHTLEKNFSEGLIEFDAAIRLGPDFSDSWHYRGVCLAGLGRHLDALSSYERALNLQPLRPDTLLTAGETLFDMNLSDLSLVFIDRALQLKPRFAEAHSQKAQVHHRRKQVAEAIASFKAALDCDHPDPGMIKFNLAAMQGSDYQGDAPASYVTGLFDKHADNFESILQGSLQYSTPRLLFAKLRSFLGNNRRIIDLGCGTGLMGEHLKPATDRMVGVDLSGKMIEIAAKKNLYDELRVSDLNVFLESLKENFDTVVAADVLNYIGDLTRTFANVSAALPKEGLFAFTVEAGDEEGVRLKETMRFCHSQSYCTRLAAEHGFAVALCSKDFLRKERGADVQGYYFVLRKQ